MNGGWTAGTLVGVPLLAIVLVIGIGIGVMLLKSSYSGDHGAGLGFLLGTPVAVLLCAVIFLWPFSKEYHYWTPVTGTVEQVDKRLVADGEGMSEKIVVRFKDDPQQYGIEDTRAALLKPGDEATLLCKKAHQWGPSVDGYDCRWGE